MPEAENECGTCCAGQVPFAKAISEKGRNCVPQVGVKGQEQAMCQMLHKEN